MLPAAPASVASFDAYPATRSASTAPASTEASWSGSPTFRANRMKPQGRASRKKARSSAVRLVPRQPAMKAREAIAFMGALRGLSWNEGRKRGAEMLEAAGLARAAFGLVGRQQHLLVGAAQVVGDVGTGHGQLEVAGREPAALRVTRA